METWCEDDDAAWDALCDQEADLFQLSAVSRAATAFGASTRRIRALDKQGNPLAAMALVEVGSRRAPLADRLFARRFHLQGGPLWLSAATIDPVALVEASLDAFAAERSATESDWKPTWPIDPVAHVAESEDTAGDVWSHRAFGVAWRELPTSADDVLATLSRSHRKAVRKAIAGGVTVRAASHASEVLDLVDASFVRSGLAAPNRAFLDALRDGLARDGRTIELVAEGPPGRPEAALLAARVGDTVFNLFHGRVDDQTGGAANLLHLRLFEQAVRAGARRVHTGDAAITDDGSTGTAGILRFKRHLGFRVDPCVRAAKVHRPLAHKVSRGALSAYRFLRGEGS